MNNFLWADDDEIKWKAEIVNLFEKKFKRELRKHPPLDFGDHLFKTFRDTETEAVKLVVPRSIRKWASKKTSRKWQTLIQDERLLLEMRTIGVSIANTLRPLAGNKFTSFVAEILNLAFKEKKLPFICEMHGKEKQKLAGQLILTDKEGKKDFKPDIDIVICKVKGKRKKPVAIISAKTTLAERIMQTINWKRYISQHPQKSKKIRVYLVTLWETFKKGEINRERVQELDGVFVCNKNVREYKKIKHFSKIIRELKRL